MPCLHFPRKMASALPRPFPALPNFPCLLCSFLQMHRVTFSPRASGSHLLSKENMKESTGQQQWERRAKPASVLWAPCLKPIGSTGASFILSLSRLSSGMQCWASRTECSELAFPFTDFLLSSEPAGACSRHLFL